MCGVHYLHYRYIDRDLILIEMRLHSVQPVNEDLISGEILTEFVFGTPVAVIFAMRKVRHGII